MLFIVAIAQSRVTVAICLTALAIGINRRNKIKTARFRIVGL